MLSWALFALTLVLLLLLPRALAWLIRRRLGGYIALANEPDQGAPLRPAKAPSVAVIGAGVAGLTAAHTLAARGYRVSLIEGAEYLGGKLGSWTVELAPGRSVRVSHGFHAFFKHYENLNRLLDTLGVTDRLQSIGDYVILTRDGRTQTFGGLPKTPVLNLLGMLVKGAFSLGDALRAPGRDCYGIFLEYDGETTFRELDDLSYADFVRCTKVPPRLELAFGTFARAFFASSDRLSLAELVKAFHFYYLSHDRGLVYDFPTEDYEPWLLAPLRKRLEALGVEICVGQPVHGIERTRDAFRLGDRSFDRVVLATDARSAAAIVRNSSGLSPETASTVGAVRAGQRYAVWRIWIDRDVRKGLPVFVITDKMRVLDSVTFYHRFERDTQRDLERHGGGFVLELHSYAIPDDLPDERVRAAFRADLLEYFPELDGMVITHESFQLRADFTAFHVGLAGTRPSTDVGTPGFYCAGDWVKLPFPAMLLEAACASGIAAANAIFTDDQVQEEPIYRVPLRGLLAGLPPPPGRARALRPRA